MRAHRLGSRCWILLVLITGAAVLGSSLACAVEPAQRVARVGFVSPQSPATAVRGISAFWERLRELGYVEGQNLAIESRWADSHTDRLPALMADVIGRKVDVLVTYATQATIAAKNATSTIPIVAPASDDLLPKRFRRCGRADGVRARFDAPVSTRSGLRRQDPLGTKPADLPIEQPTQWTLVVNLKTAKPLGLTIPDSILVRADEVIR